MQRDLIKCSKSAPVDVTMFSASLILPLKTILNLVALTPSSKHYKFKVPKEIDIWAQFVGALPKCVSGYSKDHDVK